MSLFSLHKWLNYSLKVSLHQSSATDRHPAELNVGDAIRFPTENSPDPPASTRVGKEYHTRHPICLPSGETVKHRRKARMIALSIRSERDETRADGSSIVAHQERSHSPWASFTLFWKGNFIFITTMAASMESESYRGKRGRRATIQRGTMLCFVCERGGQVRGRTPEAYGWRWQNWNITLNL